MNNLTGWKSKMANDLKERIEQHELWVKSQGQKGKRLIAISEEFKNKDFSLYNLTKAMFIRCRFKACRIGRSDLIQSIIFDCEFTYCELSYSCFEEVWIGRTSFKRCSIQNTRFHGTEIDSVCFMECHLHGSVFIQINMDSCVLKDCAAKGIDIEQSEIHNSLLIDKKKIKALKNCRPLN